MRRSTAKKESRGVRGQQDNGQREEALLGGHDSESPAAVRATLAEGGIGVRVLRPCIEPAKRYLLLLAGSDAAHCFQPYHDLNPDLPETAWLRRIVHGRLEDVWPTLVARQRKGAAIAVTMAETDGRGRKSANMVRPLAVWIESDAALPRALPIPPSVTVETSPGRHHYVYMARDLTWELWHGVQRALIADYGSDPRAAHRTQVLRLPGTLHLKDPARPHLVRIVEDLTSEHIYTAAEIAAAFPPRPPTSRTQRRDAATQILRAGHSIGWSAEWHAPSIIAAFQSIDARLRARGPFVAQGDRPDDQEIAVDWSRRDWWLRALACLHHASGGSEEGFLLSCAVSGGDSSLGLVGCRPKFDADAQRRVWDSLATGDVSELRGVAVTIRTIYWIAQRYCGWKSGRRGRPIAHPRPAEISDQAHAVADAGRWAVVTGLERVLALHDAVAGQRIPKDSLMGRVLTEIRRAIDVDTGVTAIGSLTGMADTLGCATETLRRYLRKLVDWGYIIKNDGNATSTLGTSGITVALAFPEGIQEAIQAQPNSATADPPISAPTGKLIPHFPSIPGQNPSRSLYSHNDHDAPAPPGQGMVPYGEGDPLWSKAAELSFGDWIQAGVVHAEFGDHLKRLADARGKGGVSRVLIRLQELRALRSSFAAIRSDAERAADIAARNLVRKRAKAQQLPEAELRRLLEQASPAGVPKEESAAFAREMARHLDAIIREVKGDPDPWQRAHWRHRLGRQPESAKPSDNAYAAAKMKRDPAPAAVEQPSQDGDDEPPF